MTGWSPTSRRPTTPRPVRPERARPRSTEVVEPGGTTTSSNPVGVNSVRGVTSRTETRASSWPGSATTRVRESADDPSPSR